MEFTLYNKIERSGSSLFESIRNTASLLLSGRIFAIQANRRKGIKLANESIEIIKSFVLMLHNDSMMMT